MADSTLPRVLASGIDWLTATARPGDQADQLARLAGSIVEEEREAGNRQRPWQWRGYTGLAAGGAAFGTRGDGVIARLSGQTAHRWACPASQLASTITRCDLQVTWEDPAGNADDAVMQLYRQRAQVVARGRPVGRNLLRPEWDGPTLYVGKRTSENFGRLYDKHSEEPLSWPPGSVRAEIEAKGRVASALGARIGSGSVTAAFVLAYTRDWYRRRGLALPLAEGGSADLELEPRGPTDAAKTVRWLTQQVAPAVGRAVDWVGLWPTLKALGLDAAIQLEYGLCGR